MYNAIVFSGVVKIDSLTVLTDVNVHIARRSAAVNGVPTRRRKAYLPLTTSEANRGVGSANVKWA